jgi:hypothetical protein
MTPKRRFQHSLEQLRSALTYRLGRMDITALIHARLRWSRKVPLAVKNLHREFWGIKPLPVSGDQP